MSIDLTLKRNIMRRVFFVYFLKKLASPLGVKIYILGLFIWQLVVNVSVSDVIANAPWFNLAGSVSFFSYAFIHTGLIIQIVVLGGILSTLFICKDFLFGRNATTHLSGNLWSRI